jgi:L-aminopeptidase/D-esterase-like protein
MGAEWHHRLPPATLSPGAATDVAGIEVGHATDAAALTGCTVVLCREGAIAGGAVRGLAPGTRETDLLRPGGLVERVNAVLLTGGSAFGLAAADGVMRYLEEQGFGYDTGVARVPIVPAAVLFDLGLGDGAVRPDVTMGYEACVAASERPAEQGNVGAGCGASVGKWMGASHATKGGLGTASLEAGALTVAALIAVNALGDVVDPETGVTVAGARRPDGPGFVGSDLLLSRPMDASTTPTGNTVIGVITTNARLDQAQANAIAGIAHDGLARVIRPSHTLYDGDTLFCLAPGGADSVPVGSLVQIGEMAAQAVSCAILNAIWSAHDAGGLPCARTLCDPSTA